MTDHEHAARAQLAALIQDLRAKLARAEGALNAITKLPVGACDDMGQMEPCDRCGEARDIARAVLEAR